MAVTGGRATGGAQGPVTTGDTRGNDVSQREDLANFISMITRDETPFTSSIGKTKATAIFHEWQTDELATPGDSRIGEGTDYQVPGATGSIAGGDVANSVGSDFAVEGPDRARLGNYTQINGKTISVSGTRRAVDQAGVADEYAYQLKKRGTELRRDIEADLVHSFNVASGSGRRQFGGFQSFINDRRTTVIAGAGLDHVAAASVGAARGVTGAGRGTLAGNADTHATGSLSLSDIDQVMQNIYEEGGKATKIMLSPKLRRDFSDLMVTDSGVRRNIDQDGKLRQSVDIYMSDFGDLMVVPNYIMGLSGTNFTASFAAATATDTTYADGNTKTGAAGTAKNNVSLQNFSALIYDPQWFAVATLRPLQEVDVGQRGDSTVGMMVEECSLEVKNPLGCGAIYNLA
jgi:hypothetical protein